MFIYILTIFILFSGSILEESKGLKKEWIFFLKVIVFFILVLQMGLRWETGTDWNSYLNHFVEIDNFSSTSPLNNGFEFGYNFFVWLVKLFTNSYSLFLLIHSFLFYYLLFKSYKYLSSNFYLSILIFYCLFIGLEGSNRQLLSLVICIYSLKFLIESKVKYFIFFVGIATLIHTSSVLFLLYYFFNRKISGKYLLIMLILAFLIGNMGFSNSIFQILGNLLGINSSLKVSTYLEYANSTLENERLSLIGVFKRIILLIIFYSLRNKITTHNFTYNLLFNGYFIGLVFYLLFYKSLLIMISRGSVFFNAMEPLLMSSIIIVLPKNSVKYLYLMLMFVVSILYFLQSISHYSDLFIPYKGIFINTELNREMY